MDAPDADEGSEGDDAKPDPRDGDSSESEWNPEGDVGGRDGGGGDVITQRGLGRGEGAAADAAAAANGSAGGEEEPSPQDELLQLAREWAHAQNERHKVIVEVSSPAKLSRTRCTF